jgi:hypothetical protein
MGNRGGFIGVTYGTGNLTISDITANLTVSGTMGAGYGSSGGFMGMMGNTAGVENISRVAVTSTYTGGGNLATAYTGGFVGSIGAAAGTSTANFDKCSIKTTTAYTGTIGGSIGLFLGFALATAKMTINDCYVTGSGTSSIGNLGGFIGSTGGAAGISGTTVKNSYIYATLGGTPTAIGGFVGAGAAATDFNAASANCFSDNSC